MTHDVFISYSSKDKSTADSICSKLENNSIKCWYAPRDVKLGSNYAGEIVRAIKKTKIFILIFSSHSNLSKPVLKEIERAYNKEIIIIPFMIEDVPFSDNMEFFISDTHWLDAVTPPLKDHIDRLLISVSHILGKVATKTIEATSKSDFIYGITNLLDDIGKRGKPKANSINENNIIPQKSSNILSKKTNQKLITSKRNQIKQKVQLLMKKNPNNKVAVITLKDNSISFIEDFKGTYTQRGMSRSNPQSTRLFALEDLSDTDLRLELSLWKIKEIEILSVEEIWKSKIQVHKYLKVIITNLEGIKSKWFIVGVPQYFYGESEKNGLEYDKKVRISNTKKIRIYYPDLDFQDKETTILSTNTMKAKIGEIKVQSQNLIKDISKNHNVQIGKIRIEELNSAERKNAKF